MEFFNLKKSCLFIVCLFWITDTEAQNFPDLKFSVPENYRFEISKTFNLETGYTATELISQSRSVEGRNILQINHIAMNAYSMSTDEYINSFKSTYDRQGIKSIIQEINGIKYIVAGEVNNFYELKGTENYFMVASTFQNGDGYSIMVYSTMENQVDWVFRIAEQIKFY